MLSYFKRVISLDYRSLAFMRIAVGLTLLFDIVQRSRSLLAHYTDKGVLPRSELFRLWNESAFFSLYHINGTELFVGILFVITAVFALMMIVGYRTHLATVVSFVLLVSLHNKNPLVLQGGDVALRVILFWMMFLPLGRKMSLDVLHGREKTVSNKENYISVAGAAYIVQFVLIWLFTGILKDGLPWTTTLTAVAMALSLDTFTTGFGRWLKTLPAFLPYLTVVTVFLEKFIFIFFISPFKTGWVRLIGLILLAGLVFGFNMSFRLGLFGMIMISISIGFLPGIFWDSIILPIQNWLAKKSTSGLTIFYNGDCGFCNRISQSVKLFLFLHPSTSVVIASNDNEAAECMHRAHSWVIRDEHGRNHTGFRAFVALMKSSVVYGYISGIFILKPFLFIGEKSYRMVADNVSQVCVPEAMLYTKKKKNIAKDTILFGVLIMIVVWNIHTLPKYEGMKLPTFLEKPMLVLRLDQKWNMFAPYPTTEDGFYVIPGILRDGSMVDVYSGSSKISYEKPDNMAWMYQDQRWQKYMMNLWLRNFSDYRLGYGRYLCIRWNEQNIYEKHLVSYDITFVLEETDMNTLQEMPLNPVILWHHECLK